MSIHAYRHYLAPTGPGQPLLFLFHGTGGDEHQLRSLADAVLPDAGIVAPRGDVNEQGAARFSGAWARGAMTWTISPARPRR